MRALIFVLLTTMPVSVEAAMFAYVSLDGEHRIAVYQIDEKTGVLTKVSDAALESAPGALCVSPDNRLLFASLRSRGKLASFRIDPQTGRLDHLKTVEGGEDPAFVATDRSGRFLLTAYYVAAKVTVHAIADDGHLSDAPLQSVRTRDKAHAILTDRENRFVFVPHTGPNAIFQFKFDGATGRLSPNRPALIETGANSGPRQLALHPRLDIVFFDYEQGSAIAAYDLDRKTGCLTFRERLTSLPENYAKPNSNARIEITPDGRFVYVANRGHDSLARFAVDPLSGKLVALGQTLTEATPRGFTIDPSGQFLYAAGQSTGKLAAFRIDSKSGGLTRFSTYDVGQSPWWVLVVRTQQ